MLNRRTRVVLIIWAMAFALLMVTLGAVARAEVCRYYPEPERVEQRAGYRWQHRPVDGKRCWYYSNRVLPVTDLVWSFSEAEFNADVDRVIERKFYPRVGRDVD